MVEEEISNGNPFTHFLRLRGFDASLQIILDAMHTIGGVLKKAWMTLQGLEEQPRVHLYEAEVNQRMFESSHIASKT